MFHSVFFRQQMSELSSIGRVPALKASATAVRVSSVAGSLRCSFHNHGFEIASQVP